MVGFVWKSIESEKIEDPIILKAKVTGLSFKDNSFKSPDAQNAFGTVHDVVMIGNHICFKDYKYRWIEYAGKPTPEPDSKIYE